MKAEWIRRDNGTYVLPLPGRKTLLAEVIPTSHGYNIWILDRMMWSSAPTLERATQEALEMIRRSVGEILVVISELPAIEEEYVMTLEDQRREMMLQRDDVKRWARM